MIIWFLLQKSMIFFNVQDTANNVIIIKEASAGYEAEEPIILQGHMDMVAVKDADCPLSLEHKRIVL